MLSYWQEDTTPHPHPPTHPAAHIPTKFYSKQLQSFLEITGTFQIAVCKIPGKVVWYQFVILGHDWFINVCELSEACPCIHASVNRNMNTKYLLLKY